ncbi:MAG TPA: amino acid deaminase/aldolase [Capillimicrobium sp.]|jgi:D-serine deaminase-like pyridoxal phosphate-dependent protein
MTADATYDRFERALGDRDAPLALVDLDALWANGADLVRAAAGTPIRVASKSVRARALLRGILDRDPAAFRGLMTFTLPESLWLAEHGFDDLLLAYPTVDRAALRRLAERRDGAIDGAREPILMVDSGEQLDLIARHAGGGRVCLDVDLSWWALGGRVRVGAKRSPVRTPDQAAALARDVLRRPGFTLAGVMGYESQVAGVGDAPPSRARGAAIGWMQRRSVAELRERRAVVVEAVRTVVGAEAPLLVNGGGTGSVHLTAREPSVTEVTAGSGFFAPALFDHYRALRLRPAAYFALPVVRRQGPGSVTALGGGYLASGPADALRLPVPALPPGLKLDPLEGAGEVQTPLTGPAADALRPGDRVYLRHSKAGELCERFDTLLLVEGDRVVDEVPTYRGEGKTLL